MTSFGDFLKNQLMDGLILQFDAQLYYYSNPVIQDDGTPLIQLKEVYKVSKGRPALHGLVGTWNPSKGMKVSSEVIWERRRNLSGLKLRVTTMAVSCFCNESNLIEKKSFSFSRRILLLLKIFL